MEPIKWQYIKCLGNGTFGSVSLYKNLISNEFIALKKCNKQEDITERAKKRWNAECEIMLQLDHKNIVKGIHVDNYLLQMNPSPMPLLAMEYCDIGDLRKILGLPENIFGLAENEVRAITKDISSAIEYIHLKNIVHRDLKPENIVIKSNQNKYIYKLIDLGYAKDLTGGSVLTSFVGTLHYLAPELFTNNTKEYTRTVDYWSLGNTIFECITGFRPFQNHEVLITWLSLIQAKKDSHICFKYDENKNGQYSEKLPSPNHLCRTSQVFFEQWLRLMLKYEASQRGGEGETLQIRPKCFEMLDEIMKTKILRIYRFESNNVITVPIQIEENYLYPAHLFDLVNCLYQNINNNEDIVFLDKTGRYIDKHACPKDFCIDNMDNFSNDDVDIFVYKDSTNILDNQELFAQNTKVKKRPNKLKTLYELSKTRKLSVQEIIDFSKIHTYYSIALYNDSRIVNMFCLAVRNRMEFLKKSSDFRKYNEYFINDMDNIEIQLNQFKSRLDLDIKYLKQNYDSADIINQWTNEIYISKYSELKSNFSNLQQIYSSIYEVENSLNEDILIPLSTNISEAKEFYKQLKSDNQKFQEIEMEELQRKLDDVILNYSRINTLQIEKFKQFLYIINSFYKIEEEINSFKEKIKNFKELLHQIELDRQKSIWNLVPNQQIIKENNDCTIDLCLKSANLQQQLRELLF